MRFLVLAILALATIFPIEFALAESLSEAFDKCASAPKGKADLSEKGILKTCLHRAGLYSAGCDLVSDDKSYSMSCDVDQAKALFRTKVEGCIFQVSNQLDQYNKSRFYLTRNSAPNSPVCKYDGYTLHADARIDLTNVKRKSDSSWDMPDIVFPILLRDKFDRSNVVIREVEPVADVPMKWASDGTDENPVYSKKPACETKSIEEMVIDLEKEMFLSDRPSEKKRIETIKTLEKKLGSFSKIENRLPIRNIIGTERNVGAHYPVAIEVLSNSITVCGKSAPKGQQLRFAGRSCNVIPNGFVAVSGFPVTETTSAPKEDEYGEYYSCKPVLDPNKDFLLQIVEDQVIGKDPKFKVSEISFKDCTCSKQSFRYFNGVE